MSRPDKKEGGRRFLDSESGSDKRRIARQRAYKGKKVKLSFWSQKGWGIHLRGRWATQLEKSFR